jgi:AraC-like DNA-binding protein
MKVSDKGIIVCQETGEFHWSLKQCAKHYGFSPRALARRLNGHGSRRSTHGFSFRRMK